MFISLLLLCVCAGFSAVSSFEFINNTITKPFNSTINFTCNHGVDIDLEDSPPTRLEVGWHFRPKYNNGTYGKTFRELYKRKILPKYLRTVSDFSDDRVVSFDDRTGTIVLKEVGCFDDGTYRCHVFINGGDVAGIAAEHHVRLGLPDDPQVNISDGMKSIQLSTNETCKVFMVSKTTDTITIKSSVTSRPAVRMLINGNMINSTCQPYGQCAAAGEMRCFMIEEFTDFHAPTSDLRVMILYYNGGLWSWSYCAQLHIPVAEVTMTATPAGDDQGEQEDGADNSTEDEKKDGEVGQQVGDEEEDGKEEEGNNKNSAGAFKSSPAYVICALMIAVFFF